MLTVIIIFLSLGVGFSYIIIEILKRYIYITKFTDYISTLEYMMNISYEEIYKSHILSFHSNGHSPDRETIDTANRDFVKLTTEMLGPFMEHTMIDLFGNRKSFDIFLLLYLKSKIDNDFLLEHARKANLMEDEPMDNTTTEGFINA